jgi:hypothetical protein
MAPSNPFADYFQRLEAIVNQNYDDTAFPSDLTGSGITKEYFSKIDQLSDSLLAFIQDKVITPDVIQKATKSFPFEGKGPEGVMLCFLMELVNCYEEMNHRTNLSSSEGIALLNILEKVYRPDYYMAYEYLSEVPQIIINLDEMVVYISNCIEAAPQVKIGSLISFLLQDIDAQADKDYRIRMYYLCEAISEADGKITVSESDYLKSLLRLDDNDINNDIIIDSIFDRQR